MIGQVIAQAQRYVNITLEPSVVTAESVRDSFYGAGNYLLGIDYSQTTGAENIEYLKLNKTLYDYDIKYSGPARLNLDILKSQRYVTLHIETDGFEKENMDYMFQCGEYLVGEIDLSKISGIRSMKKIFDGDTNLTSANIDVSQVVDARYAFRNTKITKLDMNKYRSDLPADSYTGIVSGVTTLTDITIDGRNSAIWSDISPNLSNDVKIFKANKCDYVESVNASSWTACEALEVESENLTSVTLPTSLSSLKSLVLKSPRLNFGATFSINAPILEKFLIKAGGITTFNATTPKLKSIDLTGCPTVSSFTISAPLLNEFNLSGTAVTSIDLTGYTNLKAPGSFTGVLGWYAKNCESLKTVSIRMDQVRCNDSDSPNQLEGCTELEKVYVYADSAGEAGGLEYHYGTEYHYGKMYLDGEEIKPGGGGGSVEAVNITKAQYDALSEADKLKDVYYNITDDGYTDDSVVHVTAQTLTDTQKAQARSNIGISLNLKAITCKVEFSSSNATITIGSSTETKTWTNASGNRAIRYINFGTQGLNIVNAMIIYWSAIEVIPVVNADNNGSSLTLSIKTTESITTGYVNICLLYTDA